MKPLFRTSLAAVLMFSVIMAVGCSKKENPAAPAATNPPAQQVFYAQAITSNGLDAIDFANDFSGGLSGWNPGTSRPKSIPSRFSVPAGAKWDTTGWHGPTTHSNYWNPTPTNGWYYFTLIDSTTMRIRFWAKVAPPVNPTRVDWECNLATGAARDTVMEFSAYCTEPSANIYSGGWYLGYCIGGNTIYYWRYTWTNVTGNGWNTNPRTCSGQFDYTSNYGVSGRFTFTNGSGTGSASLNGTVFVNYVFNNNGTGYYTIVGYSTRYPFNW